MNISTYYDFKTLAAGAADHIYIDVPENCYKFTYCIGDINSNAFQTITISNIFNYAFATPRTQEMIVIQTGAALDTLSGSYEGVAKYIKIYLLGNAGVAHTDIHIIIHFWIKK